VLVRKDAFVAFLDARQLIEKVVLTDVNAATKGWQPIATHFKAELTPNVLLFDGEVTLGFYDEDCESGGRRATAHRMRRRPLCVYRRHGLLAPMIAS
jgi:ketosteroid isomerase-like protein